MTSQRPLLALSSQGGLAALGALNSLFGEPVVCTPDSHGVSGPISRDNAIVSLRYPLSRDTFSAIPAIPQQGAIPPLGALFYTGISVRYPILQHIARYLCDTPGKQARKSFAILSLKVARDMKSIAAGPLSPWLTSFQWFQ